MSYANRFFGNANGAITFTGNTFGLSKENNANNPGTAHAIGTFFSADPTSVDGGYPAGTTSDWRENASTAILQLPATTTEILYAELIWGGSYDLAGEDVSAFLNDPVTLVTPKGRFSIESDPATRFTLTQNPFYVRSANVTNYINRSGSYRVLSVPGTQGNRNNTLNHAGWTLAVVYADPLQRSRNLSLFVGAEFTSSSTGNSTASVSGFATPTTGEVNGRLLVSAQEGDSSIAGDQLQFGPSLSSLEPVSGPNNSLTNFFASQINNDKGRLNTTGSFGTVNHPIGTNISGARQGWDITNVDVSSGLINNQTSAIVRGTTRGDTYVINALALQIDINAPIFTITKESDVSSARTGDTITYTVRVTNSGTADADLTLVRDALSSGTDFVSDSLTIDGITQPGVDIRDNVPLGSIEVNQTKLLTYQAVAIEAPSPPTVYSNQLFIKYQFESTPGDIVKGSSSSPVNKVTAINTPPTVPNYTVTNPEDVIAIGQVVGNDVDFNPLTYRLGTNPSNGTVTVNPNGQFVYTPDLNFAGTDAFTVIVDDGQGGTATSTVTIVFIPVNDPPVTQDYSLTTLEDTLVEGAIVATDPDGDGLTFTLQDAPQNGVVNVNPDGTYSYIPNENFNGVDTFSVLVSDAEGSTAVSTVTIKVIPVNDPPVVPDYSFTTQEETPVLGAVIGTDTEGELLVYSLQSPPVNGDVTVNVDGTFTYTPNTDFTGSDTFTVLVSDEQGLGAVSTITINVLAVNDPPVTGDLNLTIDEDTTVNGQVVATDPDGDPLTFTLQAAPQNGIAIVNEDGTYTYTPNNNFTGIDLFTVLVSDGQGGTATSTITITVLQVNDPPIVPNYTVSTEEDAPVVGTVVGTDPEGSPLTYSLQLEPSNGTVVVNDDGMFKYMPNENFTGTDTFTVLVTDTQGATAISTVTVKVVAVNDPPVTSDVSYTIDEDTTVSGQVVATDPEGDLLTFELENSPQNGVAIVNVDGTFTYTPNENFTGTDMFMVLVSDDQGDAVVSTVTIKVIPVNDPPVVPDYTFTTEEDVSLDGAIVGTDVEGSPLTYTLQLSPSNGTVVINVNGTFTYTPDENFTGTDTFSVLVSDSQGGSSISSVTIDVVPVNDPPVTSDVSLTTDEDIPVNGQVVATDPEGDPLTFSLFNSPTNGTAVVNVDGTFTYTPNLDYNGTDVFTVLVSDGQGGTAVSTVMVTINPVDDPPVAFDQSISTEQNTSIISTVQATDPEGLPLTYVVQTPPANGVVSVNTDGSYTYTPNTNFTGQDTFSIAASDPAGQAAVSNVTVTVIPTSGETTAENLTTSTDEDTPVTDQIIATNTSGNPLVYSIETEPTNGTVTIDATTGVFTYTPNVNFNGSDTFSVLVTDSFGGTAIAGVVIDVIPVNDPPTVPDYTLTTLEDVAVSSVIVGTDVDRGTVLTYTLLAAPTNGTAVVNVNGMYTYTPNENVSGTDTFTVLVDDGAGGTAVSTITIIVEPVNDPPVVPNELTFTTPEDTEFNSQVIATDPEGGLLTYTLEDLPTNGTAVVNSDGTFTYTPDPNVTGEDAFSIRVTDEQGNFSITNIIIEVVPVNDPPIVPNYAYVTPEDVAINSVVMGSDIDGNPLTYSLQIGPTNGAAIVNLDGTFTYTPALNFNGVDTFTVLVDDGEGGTAVSTITVTVNPVIDPPVGPDEIMLTTLEDTPVTSEVGAFNPDGGLLTYTLEDSPTVGTVVINSDGTFTYTPNENVIGSDSFSILVTNEQGEFIIVNVVVMITKVNDPPVVPDYAYTTSEDTPFSGEVVAFDVDGNPLTYSLEAVPINGTVIVNVDGTFTYTPNLNFNGVDTFTVLVDDDQGSTAISTITVTVTAVNDPPIGPKELFFIILEDTDLNSQIVAFDPDGDSLTFTLDSSPSLGAVFINSDGTFTYTPNANVTGIDTFSIRISDSQGNFIITNIVVTITAVNDVPTVPDYSITVFNDRKFSGQVVGRDEEGNPLTYLVQDLPEHGTVNVNPDGSYTYVADPDYVGSDRFTVLVEDTNGSTALSVVNVTVVQANRPPVTNDFTIETIQNQTISGQVPGFDPDGDPITYTISGTPFNGTVTVDENGVFEYTPELDFAGVDSFIVQLKDSVGGTAQSNVTVIVQNDPPIVADVSVTTIEGEPVSGRVTAEDPEGGTVTYQLNFEPLNGTVVVNANGTFAYTPGLGFVGTDTFAVAAIDSGENVGLGTVTVTVLQGDIEFTLFGKSLTTPINTPVSDQVDVVNPEGLPITYQITRLPDNGTVELDPDGLFTYTPDREFANEDLFNIEGINSQGVRGIETVTILVVDNADSIVARDYELSTSYETPVSGVVEAISLIGEPLTYALGTSPANGTATVNLDGNYTYTPNDGFFGVDSFIVIVSDPLGDTATSVIQVFVQGPQNLAPVTADQTITTVEEQTVSGKIEAFDPEGGQLTFTLLGNTENGTPIVNEDGTFTYTPRPNFIGTDTFSVLVTDEIGLTATSIVTVNVTPFPNQILVESTIVQTLVDQFVTSPIYVTDQLGRPLAYELATPPEYGKVIINADGTFTYTPNPGYVGIDTFTVLVQNDQSDEAIAPVNIVVVPLQGPITTQGVFVETSQNQEISGQVVATDSLNGPLRYDLAVAPINGSVFVNADGAFTYTPYPLFFGTDQFIVEVRNERGDRAFSIVTAIVNQVQDKIQGKDLTVQTIENQDVTGRVIATDQQGRPLTYSLETSPLNGSVIVNSNGTFTYTPNPNFVGTDIFTVLVQNDVGNQLIIKVTVNITAEPLPPIVENEQLSTSVNQSVRGQVKAKDPNGLRLFYSIQTLPQNGVVELNETGEFTYTPFKNFVGEDQFIVLVTNEAGLSSTATITIDVSFRLQFTCKRIR
ncbi:Ig-like domain-containing protein [Metabacillus iocasae]|uniref:VCBS repeat-containing protein n=1 Tax=Priestia iocasae TaxID=2291674 RepID=A0ABS2QUD1_9BACI|nr:Ig-like domain-containing protein [Metabacillus iocasae]MBM7702908.1 VCBS repeat-containing protein [Metabacillus iocasae]